MTNETWDFEKWRASIPTIIQQTDVGEYFVSTIEFHDPHYFETAIFDGDYSVYEARWPTLEEAIDGHERTVRDIDTIIVDW